MQANWNDSQPIYRQLRDKVIASILDNELKEGDALPSVRQVSADFQLNPITVSKAYQELVDDSVVEKKRGVGMFIQQGAREKLLNQERQQFLTQEWPLIVERISRLGLKLSDLPDADTKSNSEGGNS
ncbi:GntR family transcriptional regulator [Pleionea mediterranea]|uniref:GntR family transcriptional regulator n=1 Tax=Pleionea mediterranea TaxID=523701 RepID=A0A316FL47_9GAMM|nr:GntR family transcriptional regulator [Pleionea mediterranea]PWK49239.1 GntR family transcriptional regulator [Pleionea mediterranea]